MRKKLARYVLCAIAIIISGTAAKAGETGEFPYITDYTYPVIENVTEDIPINAPAGWQEIENKKYYFLPETGEMATGWQEIESKKYYFLPETGEMATGWQEIESKKYYFLPETGEMVTGWQEIDERKYYFSFETGVMLQGRQEIDGKAYFFDENGILCVSGWAGTDDKTYYCGGEDGCLVTGWKKIDGCKYYFLPEDNYMATGLYKIKNCYYIFHSNGKLAKSDSITIVTAGDKVYCAGPDGKASGGWQIKKGKLYYANKKGIVKTDTKYQGITFTGTGEAKSNINSKLKIMLIRKVNSLTNRKMSKKEKLKTCWDYITGGKFRYASKYPDLSLPGWQIKTAYDMLSTHTGNCYSYACAFAALASEAGYKPYIICGRVHGSRDRAADGYTRHAWIKINSRYYDPEAHYAKWLKGVYAKSRYPAAHKITKIVAYNKY
jgi:glucan-binding YG repeat protein